MIFFDLIKKYALSGYDFIDDGANMGLRSLTASNSNSFIKNSPLSQDLIIF